MTTNESRAAAVGPVGEKALREALTKAERSLSYWTLNFPNGPGSWQALRTLDDVRSALAQFHPTTGQETVATPRDGGVREALDKVLKRHLMPTLTKDERDDLARDIQALSAPGGAGPGETTDRQTVDVSVFGPIDGLGNLDKSGAYIGLSASGKATAYGFRISIGAAEVLAAELADLLETPTTVQPNTGETGDGWRREKLTTVISETINAHISERIGSNDRDYLARCILADLDDMTAGQHEFADCYAPTPTTKAETPGPADQTKGDL